MDGKRCVYFSFSGINVRFLLPAGAILPGKLTGLICPEPETVHEEYEICLLSSPLEPHGAPVFQRTGILFYPESGGILRIYTSLIAPDGCQVACLLRPDGKNRLYYPACQWDHYRSPLNFLHLIGGEVLLLKYNAFLLHSSVVMVNGKAVLFSGPSGAGKSTQADLWAHYLGAERINGDRCAIMEKEGVFYGGGSPWSGTSGICRKEQAPIAGILLVNQAQENSLEQLGFRAFQPLFSQTIVNSWDTAFMEKVTALFSRLLEQVPVYRLNCRPDEDAVKMVYNTLF